MNSILSKLALPTLFACTFMGGAGSAGEIFRDEFNDANLEQRWEIKRPSSASLAVENGELMLLSSKYLLDEKGELENILTPKVENLEGDWTMHLKFSGEFQTAREELTFGITNGLTLGKDDIWAGVGTRGDKYYGWAIYGAAGRKKEERNFFFSRDLKAMSCNVCSEDRMFPEFAKTIPQPIAAKFEKTGQQYVLSVRLGAEDQPWTTIERITAINAAGKPFIVLRQTDKMTGETLIRLDSVVIESHG